MIPEALAVVGAAVNPAKTKRKKNPNGSGSMIKRGKTVGKRLQESFTTLPGQGLDVLGFMVGGSAANLIRTQVISRLPMHRAGALQITDLLSQNLITATAAAMIPGDFGYMMQLGVRANTLESAGRAVIPPRLKDGRPNPALALFGVDEFRNTPEIESSADESIEAAVEGMQRPGGVSGMQRPGGVGRGVRLSRAS